MSELRQQKLASLIQAKAGQFLLENRQDWGIKNTVLVDGVLVSPDLKNAQIWVSFSQADDKRAGTQFALLERHMHELVSYLFKELNLRRMPQLHFKLSNTDKAFKLMDIFDTIRGEQNSRRDLGDTGESAEDHFNDSH
jgi:ribosome-binding factor A